MSRKYQVTPHSLVNRKFTEWRPYHVTMAYHDRYRAIFAFNETRKVGHCAWSFLNICVNIYLVPRKEIGAAQIPRPIGNCTLEVRNLWRSISWAYSLPETGHYKRCRFSIVIIINPICMIKFVFLLLWLWEFCHLHSGNSCNTNILRKQ